MQELQEKLIPDDLSVDEVEPGDLQPSCSDEDDSVPGSLSDEDRTMAERPAQDLDATEINFTGKPAPGYQEVEGDLISSWKQKKKGHVYALTHCISSDAKLGEGIAVHFCNHFMNLRQRVESAANVKPALIPIFHEEDSCWVYNLVPKQFHFHRPNRVSVNDWC